MYHKQRIKGHFMTADPNGSETASTPSKSPILETTDDAIAHAKRIMRLARFGAISVIEAGTGHPLVTRTNCALTMAGDPIFLMSDLAAHTKALMHDARSALLIGEPGKGDALAHPRLTLIGNTTRLNRSTGPERDLEASLRQRYMCRHPKAELYNDLPDFHLYQMQVDRALFNAGFGKAYTLTRQDLILSDEDVDELRAAEPRIITHMNEDHSDAICHYAKQHCNCSDGNWRLTGCDPEGVDLMKGDEPARLNFKAPCSTADKVRKALVEYASLGGA